MHGRNQFNWIIWIADWGRGPSALASLNQIFPIVAISKRKASSSSSLRVCFKKGKKEKKKISNDLIVCAKTDDLKKKRNISRLSCERR